MRLVCFSNLLKKLCNYMRLILTLQLIFLYACFSSLENCNTTDLREIQTTDLNSEDLVLNEKLLLMLYGSEEDKEKGLKELKSECSSSRSNSAQACYNLASHLFIAKKFSEGIEFSKRATKLSQKDNLYKELNRLFHVQLNKKLEDDDNYYNELTLLESACKRKNFSDAKKHLKFLSEQKKIYKENLKVGFIKDCFEENLLIEYSKDLNSKKNNYSKIYEVEKNKSHPFRDVWDFEDDTKRQITVSWKNFRKSVSKKDENLALKHLGEYLEQLEKLSNSDSKNEKYYSQLKLASRLLVEQDEFFNKLPNLKKQFDK